MSSARKSSSSNILLEEKAVVYTRVSTKQQKKKGLSIESQVSMARDYIQDYNKKVTTNLEIIGETRKNKICTDPRIFEEDASASNAFREEDDDIYSALHSRPKLQEILDLAQQRAFKHLIVYSHDRLARNFEQFISLKYIFDKNGVSIHYSKPGEMLNVGENRISRFLDNILASVAELEANIIGTRVKGGCETSVKKGRWPGGRPPYGYVIENEKVVETRGKKKIAKLKKEDNKANKVRAIFDFYIKHGYGYRKVAEEMNKKFGENKFKKSSIEKIIKNETYTGRIAWRRKGGVRHPTRREEPIYSTLDESIKIIDMIEWDDSVNIRNRKDNLRDPYYFNTKFILKDKLCCMHCENQKTLATRNYGKRADGKEYCVYRCDFNSKKNSHFSFEKNEIEEKVIKLLSDKIRLKDTDDLWERYNKESDKKLNRLKLVLSDLDEKIKEIDKLKYGLSRILNQLNKTKLDTTLGETNLTIAEGGKKKQADKKSVDELIKEKFNIQEHLLLQTKEKYEKEKLHIEEQLSNYSKHMKEKFEEVLQEFNINIIDLDTRSKRIYIDHLVKKINIRKLENSNEIDLEIILNPPQLL
jgi:site-specific DNA recombinase